MAIGSGMHELWQGCVCVCVCVCCAVVWLRLHCPMCIQLCWKLGTGRQIG
jgi:hypothetical protein